MKVGIMVESNQEFNKIAPINFIAEVLCNVDSYTIYTFLRNDISKNTDILKKSSNLSCLLLSSLNIGHFSYWHTSELCF